MTSHKSPSRSMFTFLPTLLLAGCVSTTTQSGPDGGAAQDGGSAVVSPDGGAPSTEGGLSPDGAAAGDSGPAGFAPSNFTLGGLDVTRAGDEDLRKSCEIQTDKDNAEDCFLSAVVADLGQGDGSKIHVVVVRSLTVEPTASITVTGDLPVAIVALGDMTILGAVDAHATGGVAAAGGYQSSGSNGVGAGPGAGAAATGDSGAIPGVGAGGGSYCGLGGRGASEPKAPGAPASAGPYGSPEITPLIGGSSGGDGIVGGGAGGGAVQLVAFQAFRLGAGARINVGGGGGNFGGTLGQNAGGGGSGGSILIEASTASIEGILAAGGGGGGGSVGEGHDGTPDAEQAPGGKGWSTGGKGGAGRLPDGANGIESGTEGGAGGGGGGAGRIRVNTNGGAVDLSAALVSPDPISSCTTQGKVHRAAAFSH